MTPKQKLASIVAREINKIETWSNAEALLDEKHLKALESLAKVLKFAGDESGPIEDEAPVDMAALTAALGG